MTAETKWLERLERLHPPLARPRPLSGWAARQGERDYDAERDYDNDAATWAAIVAVIIVAALGLWLAFRLIEQSRLDDCLLAHRRGCDQRLR